MPAPLHGSGWLQNAIERVCKAFADGKIKLPEGKLLTPSTIANEVQRKLKLDAPPSTGAVAACLDRWEKAGAATLHPKPKAFKAFTKAYESKGLAGLKSERSEGRKAVTATRRAEAAAAKKAAAPAKPKATTAKATKTTAKKAPAKKAAAAKKVAA